MFGPGRRRLLGVDEQAPFQAVEVQEDVPDVRPRGTSAIKQPKQVRGPALRRNAGIRRPVIHLGARVVRHPQVNRQPRVYQRRLGHPPFLGGKPAHGVNQAAWDGLPAGIRALASRDPHRVPRHGCLSRCGRGITREPGRAPVAPGCRMWTAGQRPPWLLCRDKTRSSPGASGPLPSWCLPWRRYRRLRPRSSDRGGCTAAVRRGRTAPRATVTWHGHLPRVLDRPRVRMRCPGAACARVGSLAARADPATQPSSKASEHDDKGDASRTPSPHPLLVQPTRRSRLAHLPGEAKPSGAVLCRSRPRQLVNGPDSRAIMVTRRGAGSGHCWLNSYRRGVGEWISVSSLITARAA